MKTQFFAWLAIGTLWAANASGAVSVESGSIPLTFDTQPAVADWSTLSVAGGGGDFTTAAALDAAVVANASASAITTTLPSSSTMPPSANALGRWNTSGLFLQTRSTGNAYALLMATLVNNTGGSLAWLTVSYDWNQLDQGTAQPIGEHIFGQRAFFSLTGEPGSWQLIPEFSTFTIESGAQRLTAGLSLGSWADGATLYLLWADDNGPGGTSTGDATTEGAYSIDNFAVDITSEPASFVVEPASTTVAEFHSVTLTSEPAGSPPFAYQWFKDGAPISGATLENYTIARATTADNGQYQVELSNPINTITSSNATLTVDVVPPTVLSAVRQANYTNIVVTFSKPMGDTALEVADYLVTDESSDDQLALSGTDPANPDRFVFVPGTEHTRVLIATAMPEDLGQQWILTITENVTDQWGTPPLNAYTAEVEILSTMWRAFNDHDAGDGTAATVTTYSITTTEGAGGPLVSFVDGTPTSSGVEIVPSGSINGTTGDSGAPDAGSPAALLFSDKTDWNASALYFGSTPYTANVTFTFTNLVPGRRYAFRGTAIRGNGYAGRWGLATLTGVLAATPAHVTGPTSPGIITNGWAPYGNNLAPVTQAAWNAGENRTGDLIGWDEIVPNGTSFSIVCSNYLAAVGVGAPVPTTGGGSTTIQDTYAYGFSVFMLAELGPAVPLVIVEQPPALLDVEEQSLFSLSIAVTGSDPQFQWFKGTPGSGTPIDGATAATYSVPSASLSDAGSYYVQVQNEISAFTSSATEVSVFVNPIVITQPPAAVTEVTEFRPFSLSVQATGTVPLYQWYRKAGETLTPIDGATSATYTVASASMADAGDYVVEVSNTLHEETSSVAQVVVNADVVPPTVARIIPGANFDRFIVEFDEQMDASTVIDEFSYEISGGLHAVAAVATNDGWALIVETSGPLTPDTLYTVSFLAGPADLAGNGLVPVDLPVRSWVLNQAGGMLFEKYDVGGGNAITNLTDQPTFPDQPDAIYGLTEFNPTNVFTVGPDDAARNNYGGRVRGWFIPPFTGKWRLFLSSDDDAEVWFNPAGPDAAGLTLVAFATNCCEAFLEPPSDKTSAPFDLIAGQGYAVEALYKEGNGGDYLVVAARLEGQTVPAANLQWLDANSIGYPGLPPGLAGDVNIVTSPVSATAEHPNGASFSADATSSTGAPIAYQWQRSDDGANFTNIPGAVFKNYQVAQTAYPADNGLQFRCVVAAADVRIESDAATLTVTPDATDPQLVSAVPAENLTTITVTFSEAVDATEAGNPLNYQICDAYNAANCVAIASVELAADNTQAIVETDTPLTGEVYRLTVANVTDLFDNPLSPNTVIVGGVATFQQGVGDYAGTVDTYLDQATPDTSYATLAEVLVDSDSPLTSGLLRFDNLLGGALGQVPLDATIQSARLTFFTVNLGEPIDLHLMLQPWNDTDTWNTPWAGGIVANDVMAASAVIANVPSTLDTTIDTPITIDVTDSVQAWISGQANYGWFLTNTISDGWRFASSEAATAANRPLLTVTYTPSGATNPVQIITQPAASTTINEGEEVTFSITVSGTQPAFQWYKDGEAISGATGPSYTITGAVETDDGTYYCVVGNDLPSEAQSDNAGLTVTPDTTAPVLLDALSVSDTTIVMNFSKPLDPLSVAELSNYEVTPSFGGDSVQIVGADLADNGDTVRLTTSPRAAWQYFTLTVRGLTDAAYRRNVLDPNPTTLFLPFEVTLLAADASWRYEDTGRDLGTAWTGAGYDDAIWTEGPALLWAARFNNPINPDACDVPPATMMAWTNTVDELTWTTNITYYVRTHFTAPSLAELAELQSYQLEIVPVLDDGAVFYLNGEEARRVGMAEGALTWETFANRSQGSEYRWEGPYELPLTNVVNGGDNVLAAEVHQVNLTSSDLAFAAKIRIHVPALEMRVDARVDGSNVSLAWPPATGFRLYEADNLEGPYTPVLGDPGTPYTVPGPLATKKFYRVQNP